jgi:hypothetical protein
VTVTDTRRDYGPHQLADYLGTFRSNVDRARFFGLIPGPDCGDGKRWSAAAAEKIRADWPEILAAIKCVGAAGLKARGWTEGLITTLLGDPDLTVDNPHYKTAAPMRLWRLQRAEAAEALPEFTSRSQRAKRERLGRQIAAAKAQETRQIWKALGGYQ